MSFRVAHIAKVVSSVVFFAFVSGCAGGPSLRTVIKPSESKRQFLGMKKIAVLPPNNISSGKDSDLHVLGILISELNIKGTFEEIEDPRYVANTMKALKLRKLDELDLETVQKLGSEMNVQAVLFSDIHAWGLGEGSEAAMNVSITLTLMDTQSGKPVWVGYGAKRASFTLSRAVGLDEGPIELEIGREVIIALVKDLHGKITNYREDELSRIKSEESAKLKAAAEAEKRRLEEMMKEEEPGK